MKKLTIADYPLAETRPDQVRGKRGLTLEQITLKAVMAGEVSMADLQITSQALQDQAEIAADAGRPTLALNFQRAAELVDVPQDLIMSTYELLRPGRARGKQELLERAALLRDVYAAQTIAELILEAAEIYEKRGLFSYRF
jgi:glycerol dehydratase small subunit/propanediol dehydratase small subunit